MSNLFNARLEISNCMPTDINKWFIEGQIKDGSGLFSDMDVIVGDIIYIDQSAFGFGLTRYKIINIDTATTFGHLAVTVTWDDPDSEAIEPISGFTASIGRADGLGTSALTNTSINLVEESFIANAKNFEAFRQSKRLSILSNNIEILKSNKENKLSNPTIDGAFLTSLKNGTREWKNINPIDASEKGIATGVATLDYMGKIPLQQLPAIAITDVYVVANETEMLSLIAQTGDVAVRTDSSNTYILKSEPASILNNWVKLASSGGSGGSSGGTSSVSNETRRIQPYRKGATYSIGEMVLYNNLIYMAKKGLFSVGEFNNDDWLLVAGNMSSYNFDSDGDGIIDRSNQADTAKYSMISDITRMIQTWKPNTQYATGEQLIYGTEFYLVKANFTSSEVFETKYLEPMSLKKHSVLLELQGGDSSSGTYYHLNSQQYNLITNLSEQNDNLLFKSKKVGDMYLSIYDYNSDGIVNSADTLNGLISTVEELNLLKGIKSNVQQQLDTFKLGISIKGSVSNYASLIAINTKTIGDSYIVTLDETQLDSLGNPQKTMYIWDGTAWKFISVFTITVRDFGINPININTESIGTLPENRIDKTIARKSDLHIHVNKSLLDSYSYNNSQIGNAINNSHTHNNQAILDGYSVPNGQILIAIEKTHSHTNKAIIDSFSKSGDGKLLFEGKLIEGSSSSGGSTGGGITDLSGFTTNDLAEYQNKRYITDAEKSSLTQLSTLVSDNQNLNTKINNISALVPSTATTMNKLVTTQDLASKVGVTQFKQLTDINPNFIPNAFLVVNNNGSGLTYLNKIDIKIPKITDMDGTIQNNISFLEFKDMTSNLLSDGTMSFSIPKLKNLHTTDLLDMPTQFKDTNGKILVANEYNMKYELKDIGVLTNSKANKTAIIETTDWTFNSIDKAQEKIIEHKLKSQDLIVSFYDTNGNSKNYQYRIIDENQIMVYSQTADYVKVVLNCSQGAVGDGTGGNNTGGSIAVTASMFIDDSRLRLDKTFSSQHINDVLSNYPKKSAIYTRAEADANFAPLSTSHIHSNLDVMSKFSQDENGQIMYNGKGLLTNITSATHEQHWNGQDNTAALTTILNVIDIFTSKNFSAIQNQEFTIKNIIPSVNKDTDVKPENQLRLIVSDKTITLMDVKIAPQETQKYILGISPNIKIVVQGKFDANYYITAF